MLSLGTWKSVVRVLRMGRALSFYTFFVQPNSNYYKVLLHNNPKLVVGITILMMLISICGIQIHAVVTSLCVEDPSVMIFFLMIILALLLLVGVQLWHWQFNMELPAFLAKFLDFQRLLCKSLQLLLAKK